jgi:hypothetical protein
VEIDAENGCTSGCPVTDGDTGRVVGTDVTLGATVEVVVGTEVDRSVVAGGGRLVSVPVERVVLADPHAAPTSTQSAASAGCGRTIV